MDKRQYLALAEVTAQVSYTEARNRAGLGTRIPPWKALHVIQQRMLVWATVQGMQLALDILEAEETADEQRHQP